MANKGNPFRVLWENLKGRGYAVSGQGVPTLYIVYLHDHELKELDKLAEKYSDVKRTFEHIWRSHSIVFFRYTDVIKALDKPTLEEKKVRQRRRGR